MVRSVQRLLLPIVVSVAAITAACTPNADPAAISTTRAVRQTLDAWVTSNGQIEPVEPRIVQSQLNAFIETVNVRHGDMVRQGQVLLTLDAKDLESELARARGQLFAAEDEARIAAGGGSKAELVQIDSDLAKTDAEIARLRREAETLDRLYAKQAATRYEVDQNKAALERALGDRRALEQRKAVIAERAKVQGGRASLSAEEARQSIRSLQEKIGSASVKAPVSGTIYTLRAKPGTLAQAGDVLAELADLTRIRVRTFVDEPEVGLLKVGQPVEIMWDGLPGRKWNGRVEQLPNTIVARGSRNVGETLCSVDANSELLPNTNVDVRIRTASRENVLTLSRSAVRTEAAGAYVFVIEDGRLRRREIQVGISNSTHSEILSGITEKDVIALPGGTELRDGMPVNVS